MGRVTGVLMVLGGCYMIVFHKSLAKDNIKGQNEFWGYHFGEKEIKLSAIICIIVGAGFVLFGLLLILNPQDN